LGTVIILYGTEEIYRIFLDLRRRESGKGEVESTISSLPAGTLVMRLPRVRFTVRRMMVAVAVVAVIAAGVDLSVIGLALLILIRAARRPHPVHRTTAILMTLLTGVLLWANLRPTAWQEEFGGVDCPPGLDPVTRAMFWRGWPLAPCMVCLDGLRFHPSGVEQCVLALDGVLFLVALYATKATCERLLRWRRHCNL
jgi:hypothetical protein